MIILIRKTGHLKKIIDVTMELNHQKTFRSSATAVAGINTGTITNLPSGLVGQEENIDGQSVFSIKEGKAKV